MVRVPPIFIPFYSSAASEWYKRQQQKGVLEQTLINLRAKRNDMFDPSGNKYHIDTRTPNEGEYWDIRTGKVKKIEEE